MSYYKATKAGGVSCYDATFVYHEGLNVHPNPDKRSERVCPTEGSGAGICLAKSLRAAKSYGPKATEFYYAEPGVILGEDSYKVRVAYFFLGKRLSEDDLREITMQENQAAELEDLLKNIHPPPICGENWLLHHGRDITWEDYNKMTMEVSTDHHRMTLGTRLKPKELRTALAACLSVEVPRTQG